MIAVRVGLLRVHPSLHPDLRLPDNSVLFEQSESNHSPEEIHATEGGNRESTAEIDLEAKL